MLPWEQLWEQEISFKSAKIWLRIVIKNAYDSIYNKAEIANPQSAGYVNQFVKNNISHDNKNWLFQFFNRKKMSILGLTRKYIILYTFPEVIMHIESDL